MKAKRLVLNKETVRSMQDPVLSRVRAGMAAAQAADLVAAGQLRHEAITGPGCQPCPSSITDGGGYAEGEYAEFGQAQYTLP